MTAVEQTAKVLKVVVPIALLIGAAAWVFPTTFERLFGYGPLVTAQFVGLPAIWLIGAAANMLAIVAIVGMLAAIGLACRWLFRLK